MGIFLKGISTLFFVIFRAYAYDNLSQGRSIFVYNRTKLSIGTSTYDAFSCFSVEHFENLTWIVDLQDVRSVYQIEFTLDSPTRFFGLISYELTGLWSLFISNSSSSDKGIIYASSRTFKTKQTTVFVNKNYHGRYVVFDYEADNRNQSIKICDVKILGCKTGVFGRNCEFNCSKNCIGKSCDIIDGRCLTEKCNINEQRINNTLKNCKDVARTNLTRTYEDLKNSAKKCFNVTDELCTKGFINSNMSEKKEGERLVDAKSDVYGLVATLTVSILINCVFITLYCKSRIIFRRGKKATVQDTPMYANAIPIAETRNEQAAQEQESREGKIYYERINVSSSEAEKHDYDSLRS
ncbi:uncharacterized protein LOC134277367 isoform X3 [Saccostrea cucullata]|uniref:uncharacterized protein LOC134277367 isoform X3 n=2 Tax=Saccostrea cuccullata TaxID=36930 RepID=UPI002ED68A3B